MGYIHIDNLYKNIDIMNFKECYALEKIHGTSAHITWKSDYKEITYFSGGEKHERFINLFNNENLKKLFKEHFPDIDVTLFGEAYGGSQQGMSETYGKELRFIVFDVQIGTAWLNVPNAEDVTKKMYLEFIDYYKILTNINCIDAERKRSSRQALRNGCGNDKLREGIVLRPLIEVIGMNGKRVICKYKNDEFMETKTKRKVDPKKLKILEEAKKIAEEWVTPMRLTHILDKIGNPTEIEQTKYVIDAMIKDVLREAKGEIVVSKGATTAIARETARLYKQKINKLKKAG